MLVYLQIHLVPVVWKGVKPVFLLSFIVLFCFVKSMKLCPSLITPATALLLVCVLRTSQGSFSYAVQGWLEERGNWEKVMLWGLQAAEELSFYLQVLTLHFHNSLKSAYETDMGLSHSSCEFSTYSSTYCFVFKFLLDTGNILMNRRWCNSCFYSFLQKMFQTSNLKWNIWCSCIKVFY